MSGKRWALAVVLGLLSLLVLQGAVIPTATQAVSAVKELLVREQNTDDSGFIRVHEQGTADVKAQQDGDWTVGIDPAMNTVVASDSRTPVNIFKQVDMEGFDERDINMYKVPAGNTLIIKTISTRVVSSEASPNKWNVWLQIPSTDQGYDSTPTFYLNDFNEGPHGFTTASASVDIMVPAGVDVFFAFHRSEPYEHTMANASFAGYLID